MTEENKTTETDDHAAPDAAPTPEPVETGTAHVERTRPKDPYRTPSLSPPSR